MSARLPFLRSLLRPSRVSPGEIAAFQSARLRELVAHAHANVPYYRALFERAGVRPGAIRGVDDLAALPTTSRADLQARPVGELVARGVTPDRLVVHRTSGSTGEPLTIRRTWLEERIYVLLRLRALRALGLSPRDRQAVIAIVRPLDPMDVRLPQQLLRLSGLYRKASVDFRQSPAEILEQIGRLRPDVITGPPTVLGTVAQAAFDDAGTRSRPAGGNARLRPRLVVAGGELMTSLMRRQIAEGFGAPVRETYGSHEVKLIGWECRETGLLHVADDSVLVEVMREDGRGAGPDETGEVVATALHSFAMPFIRYRLGDLVTRGPAPCPCGAPFSTIRMIRGRMVDYFPLPGGRVIHPYGLVLPLMRRPWIRQYQLLQERVERIVLRVVAAPCPPRAELAEIERVAQESLGPGVQFAVALVPEIPLEPNGKLRPSRSLVSSSYDDDGGDRLMVTST
jgi:phenylacetate-CoA ligase